MLVLQGSFPAAPYSKRAVPDSDLRAYHDRKRPMALGSLALAALAAVVLWGSAPIAAVALLFGAGCGIVNAFLTMRGNELLADRRSVSSFVFSSILRIAVFGIVPVEFALHGPAWTMIAYFIGFFTPLALYTVLVARAVRTG